MADPLSDGRQWLRRAALLLNRESDLRRLTGLFLAGGVVLGPILNVLEYSLTLGVVFEGFGTGLLIGLLLVFITIENRMESAFSEYGDDEETDADDSPRDQYVRGEIDHETFKRRLDGKLGASQATADTSAEAILREQFARGDVSESEYRDRLATLRETAASDGTAPTSSDPSDDSQTDILAETNETN